MRELTRLWQTALEGVATHLRTPGAGGLTPSDLPMVRANQFRVEEWERACHGLIDVWPATAMQSGLHFHSRLVDGSFNAYDMQLAFHLAGPVDPARLRTAGQALLARHPNLRVAFSADDSGALVQLVPAHVELPWREKDLRGLPEPERERELERLLAEDHATPFDPAVPPLLRMTLAVLADDRAELVLTANHVLYDGWSLPLLMQDLLRLYGSSGDESLLPRAHSYRDFLGWLSARDHAESARAWAEELAGLDAPTLLLPEARAADAGTGGGLAQVEVPLPAGVAARLSRRAAELGVTVNTVVQAAWSLVLGALTGRDDVVFGATVSGRPPPCRAPTASSGCSSTPSRCVSHAGPTVRRADC